MPEEPKLNSGEDIMPEQVPFTQPLPRKARVVRKPGQQPELVLTPAPAVKRTRVSRKENPCCPQGHVVAPSMKFCPSCGSELVIAAPMGCPNGHKVPPGSKFCPACGFDFAARALESSKGGDQKAKEEAHAQALARGRENPVMAYAPGKAPPSVETVVAHFLVDGFTAFGNVWMRGQEIEVWPGHPRWAEAQGWINLDTAGQYARYGRQVFGLGPWPGARSYTAGAGQFQQLRSMEGEGVVAQPSEEDLRRADEAEMRRGRRVPNSVIG